MIRRWLALTYYFTPCGSPPCLIFILIHYKDCRVSAVFMALRRHTRA